MRKEESYSNRGENDLQMSGFTTRKIMRMCFLIISLCFVTLVIYTIWDNHRIIMTKQDIMIHSLPEELEDFTILQITDLHEREFGKNQTRLLEAINSVDYDVVVFTGDMLNDSTSINYRPFYSLIEGIDNKEYAFFVPGNTDTEKYSLNSAHSYEKHRVYQRDGTKRGSIVGIR